MTNDLEMSFPTEAQAEAMLVALDRLMEFKADEAKAVTPFAAYWAGSASASVSRDYKAGRVRTIKAGR